MNYFYILHIFTFLVCSSSLLFEEFWSFELLKVNVLLCCEWSERQNLWANNPSLKSDKCKKQSPSPFWKEPEQTIFHWKHLLTVQLSHKYYHLWSSKLNIFDTGCWQYVHIYVSTYILWKTPMFFKQGVHKYLFLNSKHFKQLSFLISICM